MLNAQFTREKDCESGGGITGISRLLIENRGILLLPSTKGIQKSKGGKTPGGKGTGEGHSKTEKGNRGILLATKKEIRVFCCSPCPLGNCTTRSKLGE